MSNRRRLRGAVFSQRAALVAETVVTAGMVEAWKHDPDLVPPEWQEFWIQHGPGPVDVVDRPPSQDLAGQVCDPASGDPIREATALDALAAAVEQQERVEQNVAAIVALARAEGRSWTVIGELLGMSKQAAAKRYGTTP